ncbi:MAG: hypothetical protein ACRD5M_16060 [Candidatus Acidiferrales bacterium]
MRRALWLAATAATLVFPAAGLCQQQDQQSSAPSAQAPAKQEDSLAAAARRTREQRKEETTKPAKVFDNDNLPSQGGISTVGNASSSAAGTASAAADTGTGAAPAGGSKAAAGDEKSWRKKFADLRHKLQADQEELAIMQRELGVLDLQNYNDPVKGMQQGLTRSDINDKTAKIEAKKKQIQADEQAISDAEDDLRKSGGDSGWAR